MASGKPRRLPSNGRIASGKNTTAANATRAGGGRAGTFAGNAYRNPTSPRCQVPSTVERPAVSRLSAG
jgi:hypothetical protein